MTLQQNPYERLFIYHLEAQPVPNPWEKNPSFLGSWIEDGYAFLFFSEPVLQDIMLWLEKLKGPKLIDHYQMTYAEWQGGEEILPLRAGKLIIAPFWQTVEESPESILLRIDPGVVFGTGAHPTTMDCLRAITTLYSKTKPQKIADLGTGTGILALAVAALGAEEVVAIDLNPLCVRTAKANVERNGFQSVIKVLEGDAVQFIDRGFDLLIANIHMAVVEQLLANNRFNETPWVILSGLMRSQAMEIENVLNNSPFRVARRWNSEGIWSTFLLCNETWLKTH